MRTHDGERQHGSREAAADRTPRTDRTPGPDRSPGPVRPGQAPGARLPGGRLLALQAGAGNAAVARMVQRSTVDGVPRGAGHPPAQAQAQAQAARAEMEARPATAGVLQRTASDDLPEADEPSPAVPDLPAALVTQLEQAKADTGTGAKAVRQAALDALLRHVLDQLPQAVADEGNLTLGYKHSRQGAGKPMALTSTGTSGDKVTMSLYRNLFDDYGPAVIYSTLRHELIHAAQAMLMPDEAAADGTDPHIYMDVISDIGQATFALLQQPMREIETHVWELEHAGRTGIDGGYLKETVDYLVQYADELSANLAKAAVTDRHVEYWKAYLENSVTALGRAAATPAVTGHADQALAGRITGAQARLRGAVDAKERAAPAGGKRSGGTGRGSTGRSKRGKGEED
ncbi:hypothetical protein AB0F71_13640 [Kitasatospora sp. NPDC028055]|uniref:hypothetical protein n=1 Tax=Kitasatospora sp. NPDC028055 TaxID=3155653 RepID=UPI0033D11101